MSAVVNDCPICGECFPANLKECPFCAEDNSRHTKYRKDEIDEY